MAWGDSVPCPNKNLKFFGERAAEQAQSSRSGESVNFTVGPLWIGCLHYLLYYRRITYYTVCWETDPGLPSPPPLLLYSGTSVPSNCVVLACAP